ncbi:hypothetical protein ACR6C2_08180 [Streptomyces sp. INA 01156]
MATTDSPPSSGYQPSENLLTRLAAWEKAFHETEPQAREALNAGMALELTENRQLSLPTLAEHVPGLPRCSVSSCRVGTCHRASGTARARATRRSTHPASGSATSSPPGT